MRVVIVGAEFEESLAVRYLWGALERAGHEVALVVFNDPDELDRAAAEVVASGPDLVGLSMVFTRRAGEFAALAERCRELGYSGHITAGGHFAAFNAESLLDEVSAIDSVVIGEGEAILCELAAALPGLARVKGLVWRDRERVRRNLPAEKPALLDELPWPVHRRPFDTYIGLPIANMLASRGCTHSCAFCSIAAWHRLCGGERFRLRPIEDVADEMAALYGEGVRIFNFHDDNFILGDARSTSARIDALDAALKTRGVGRIGFAIKARPDEVERSLFEQLQRMGLFRVFLGIEAGSATSLRRLGRGQSPADNEQALRVVNQLGIHTCFNLLLWNPDSTLDDVAANVAFLRSHPHNPMNFCRTEVYSGTPLERRLRRAGRLEGTFWGYDYTMADPEAQLAFDVAYSAFEERNFGDPGLHHETMRVDYELHLLDHFFGCNKGLWADVKDFIVTVNHDTCRHLETIFSAIRTGHAASDRARSELTGAMIEAVAESDRALLARAEEILEAVQDVARDHPVMAGRRGPRRSGTRRAPGWVRHAAAAGLAASLSLTTAACSQDEGGTHMTETVPLPTAPQDAGGPVQVQPSVSPDAATPTTPEPDAALPEKTPPAPEPSPPPAPPPPEKQPPSEVPRTHPTERIPSPPTKRPTHMHERIPTPPRPPTHMREMAPRAPEPPSQVQSPHQKRPTQHLEEVPKSDGSRGKPRGKK